MVEEIVNSLQVFVPFSESFFHNNYCNPLFTIKLWETERLSLKRISVEKLKLVGIRRELVYSEVEQFCTILFVENSTPRIYKGHSYTNGTLNWITTLKPTLVCR